MHIYIWCTPLCKVNKKNTLDGFEWLQGLWTDGDGGWDFRPDRFFFPVKIRARNYPPPSSSNNFCVVSRNGGSVNWY